MASNAWKEAKAFYKQKKDEEKQRKRLIRRSMDFGLLEQLIQKVNDNPDLRIDINLADGTVLHMKTYQKQEVSNLINGNYVEDIR